MSTETVVCGFCGKEAGKNDGWQSIHIGSRTFFFCPDEFPANGNKQQFSDAYARAMNRANALLWAERFSEQSELVWSADSPEAGDPLCLCSAKDCRQLIPEGNMVYRMFAETYDIEARFCPDCARKHLLSTERSIA